MDGSERERTSGWELVRLGIAVPRSYFCICCLTFSGAGMHRDAFTYCVPCWDLRQKGDPCSHAPAARDPKQQRAS
jgi:hypothetical protein